MNKIVFKAGINALFYILVLTNILVYSIENKNQTLNKKGILDKVLAFIATSSPMHRYNQFFAKRISLQGIPASEEVQALGKEAQIAVGISADRHVPIQYVPELDGAIAETNAIITGNEFTDDKASYGVKRCNMFHEAVHIKYHDDEFSGLLFSFSLLTIPFVTKMFIKPQGKLKLLYVPALLVGHYIGRAIQGQFYKYRERRADIEGHYATQCHKCVTEKTEDMRGTYEVAHDIIARLDYDTNLNEVQINALAFAKDWIKNKKRYLSIEENETIAAELKQDNKICVFHEQSK